MRAELNYDLEKMLSLCDEMITGQDIKDMGLVMENALSGKGFNCLEMEIRVSCTPMPIDEIQQCVNQFSQETIYYVSLCKISLPEQYISVKMTLEFKSYD